MKSLQYGAKRYYRHTTQGEQEQLFEYERNFSFPFFFITTYASKISARGIPLFRI